MGLILDIKSFILSLKNASSLCRVFILENVFETIKLRQTDDAIKYIHLLYNRKMSEINLGITSYSNFKINWSQTLINLNLCLACLYSLSCYKFKS